MNSSIHTTGQGYPQHIEREEVLYIDEANCYNSMRLYLSELVVRQRLVERGGRRTVSIVFVQRAF